MARNPNEDSAQKDVGVISSASGSNLHDSELSADSTEGDIAAADSGGWFGGMGADFRSMAHCLTDNVTPVVSGVASLVHRTAVAVASEIAQLEQEEAPNSGSKTKSDITKDNGSLGAPSFGSDTEATFQDDDKRLILPWEVRRDSPKKESREKIPAYYTDDELMQEILALSCKESTFLKPFHEASDKSLSEDNDNTAREFSASLFSSKFSMNKSRIDLIQRLMETDKNLASAHSRFSGKSNTKEELFWKNYFYHCEELRTERLEPSHATQHTSSPEPAEIIDTVTDDEEMRLRLERVISSIARDEDNESLVPAESVSEADDSSYVLPSAPNSLNTLTTTQSIEDLVLVDPSHDKNNRGKA